jgi:predicted transposase YbfD/YdcC
MNQERLPMKSTLPRTRPARREEEGYVIDLDALGRRLVSLTDTRCSKGLRYRLPPLLLLIVLAKLAGEDTPSGIASWIQSRNRQLRFALRLPWPRMPHHNTYRRVFAHVIQPEQLDQVVSTHLQSLPGVGESLLIAIDGKTVRGTIDTAHPQGEHLLAAYLPEEGIVLLQLATGAKENEISVAPKLVARLDVRGKVVAGDAMQTQRALSVQILAAGGDYLWLVKDNQPSLRAEIAQVFTADPSTILGGQIPHDFRHFRQISKGHGRQEIREITVSGMLKGYSDWPGLEQVFQIERWRKDLRSGKTEHELVYGLTSLTPTKAAPPRLLALVRSYWGIENGLHYRRDVTFGEDRTRLTQGHAGHVMAALNNLAIGLLKHAGATNLAEARRWCDANLLSTLAPSPAR